MPLHMKISNFHFPIKQGKNLLGFILLLLILGCNNQDPEEQVPYLGGYWEIKRVEFSKDSIREYKFNEVVEFIEITNGQGFRKKVRPQLDGSYQVTQDEEKVETRIEDGQLYLYYSTLYDTWKEKVVHAGEEQLKMENENGVIYHYERFTPLLENYYEAQ